MESRAKYLIIFLGSAAVFIFLMGFFKNSSTKKPEVPVVNKVTPSEVKSTIPFAPQSVKFNEVSPEDTGHPLPEYEVSGPLLIAPTFTDVARLSESFGFTESPQILPAYGGGTNYIYSDTGNRVLTVKDKPLSLSYSELQKESAGGSLPTIPRASALAQELAKKAVPNLPKGWSLGVIKSNYLRGTGSSSSVVQSLQDANLVEVSLGYYLQDYKVATADGKFKFFKAVFGDFGTVVSFKAALVVNNPALTVNKLRDLTPLTLEGVREGFNQGMAKAVFLGLADEHTDEPILTPPQVVTVSAVEPILVLSPAALHPYYLVTAQGSLNSNRVGEVLYLLPVSQSQTKK